jgi:hypothetical protein
MPNTFVIDYPCDLVSAIFRSVNSSQPNQRNIEMKSLTMKTITMGSLLLASSGFAGKASFTGQGHISNPPQYVEVKVQINSKCFNDINEAREATNHAATRVLDLFRTITDPTNPRDSAHTNGGTTSYSQGHYKSGTRTMICVNTFSKTAGVTLLTTNLLGFEQNFEAIEDLVYGELSGSTGDLDVPVTTVTISSPVAHVFSETVESLSIQALSLAMVNAKEKFKILMDSGCGVRSYQIESANEPDPSRNLPNPYSGTRGIPRGSGGGNAPVMFGDVWITKALDVGFDFQGGSCND